MIDRTSAEFRSYLELYEKAPLLELKGPDIDEEDFATLLPRVAAAVDRAG